MQTLILYRTIPTPPRPRSRKIGRQHGLFHRQRVFSAFRPQSDLMTTVIGCPVYGAPLGGILWHLPPSNATKYA